MKLTPRQQQVYDALTPLFALPGVIAVRAHIHTHSPYETAAKFCRQLVKLGLAQRGGTPMHPTWRKLPLRREAT